MGLVQVVHAQFASLLKFVINTEFFDFFGQLLVGLHPLFGYFDGLEPLLRLVGLIPETGSRRAGFYILDFGNLGFDVKETSSTPLGVPEGLLGVRIACPKSKAGWKVLSPSRIQD